MTESIGEIKCEEEVAEVFSLLGISKFGCEVYLKLLQEGPLTLSELTEKMEAKTSQLYYYIKELVSKGLIEASSSRPVVYRAVSPSVLEKLYIEKTESLRARILERLKATAPRKQKLASEEPNVYTLKNWRTFLARAEEAAHNATVDLVVCGDFEFVKYLNETIELKEKEGVNTYVLLYEVPGINIDYSKLPKLRKIRKYVSGDLVVISDSRVAVLSQRRRSLLEKPNYGLIIEDPVIIDYLEQDFFFRWIRSEIIRDENIKLPTSFTIFRLALYEAQKLLQKKCRLRVLVYGRYVRTGEDCMVEGELVNTLFEDSRGIAQLTIRVNGNTVTIGAQDAIIEDIAASRVEVRGAC
ncbi:MAG: hypothetical protein GU357_00135 [Thermofilum sp.]|jgi:sugar-specific transcriptional regulator TrmB|nr:hypothetical protein [Thermofilum sp.]